MLEAKINVSGTNVSVLVTHFGNTRDYLDRYLQTHYTRDLIEGYYEGKSFDISDRVLFLSYLTSWPLHFTHSMLVDGGLKDTTEDTERYCQYIMYRNLNFHNFTRIDTGTTSDTEIQVFAASV